jgi:glycerol uptake facilitator protein
MNQLAAEFLGTALLILLGNGAVANVVLKGTKGSQGGWIVITAGWSMGVFVGVVVAGPHSGAHLNPAVTLGLATAGLFDWVRVLPFIAAQLAGAMMGAVLVYVFYLDHFRISRDPAGQQGCFCTAPAIRHIPRNLFSEIVGTFVLVFTVIYAAAPSIELTGVADARIGLGSLEALPVALLVFGIGLSLGGTTGYAINPARDLGPRLVFWMLPIPGKGDAGWSYAPVPLLGPLLGGILAASVYFVTQA